MNYIRLFSLLGLLLCTFAQLNAQANLSIQGTVQTVAGGNLDNGDYTMTFRLYETATGGTPVWSETQDAVEIIGGVYSTLLGKVNPLTAAFDKTYYVGISINNGAEVVPRTRLTASPYSLSLIGQTNIFPSSGPVGAGTSTPDSNALLHIKKDGGTGRLLVESNENSTISLKKDDSTAKISYDGNNINLSNFVSLNLPAGNTVEYGNLKDWRLVDIDDFSTVTPGFGGAASAADGWVSDRGNGIESAWNTQSGVSWLLVQSSQPAVEGKILMVAEEPSNSLKKQFDLTGIPHTMIKVVFTFHFIDDWSDFFNNTAFAGFATARRTYNDNPPPMRSGNFQCGWSMKRGHLNLNEKSNLGSTTYGDYNVRGEMVAQCPDDKFWVVFGNNLGGTLTNNKSYGISDIQIWVK